MTRRPIAVIATIATASAVAMVFAACSDGGRQGASGGGQPVGYRRAWSDDDVAKPNWLSDPTSGGTIIAAWGSTQRDPDVDSATLRDRALDSARRELARMVMVKVQAVLKDYLSESNGQVGSSSESVSRSIAIQSVRSSYQRAAWTHPKTGELFIWAVADPRFGEQLAQTVGTSAASDPASGAHARAKLAADAGFQELDRLLDASFSTGSR